MNEGPVNGDLELIASQNFRSLTLSGSRAGTYVVRAEISDGRQTYYRTINVVIKNDPPAYTEVVWHPKHPGTADSIVVSIDATDPELDRVTMTYHWFLNGTPLVEYTDAGLPAGIANRDDTLSFFVTLNDGVNEVLTETYSIPISNTAPTFGLPAFVPAIPGTSDDIEIVLNNVTDVDGDLVTIAYEWFIDDIPVPSVTSAVLPASFTTRGQEVYAVVKISDSQETKTVSTAKVIISDTKANISVLNFPNVVNHNEPLAFTVTAVDEDDDPVSVALAYGPSGITMNNQGEFKWTPNEVMFGPKETFHLGFMLSDDPTTIHHRSVDVIDAGRKRPVVRSGLEIPYRNYAIWVDDFNGDGENEVLTTDTRGLVFTLKYDGSKLAQNWSYPYALPAEGAIIRVMPVHVAQGENPEIVVISDKGISRIADLNGLAELVYESESGIAVAIVGNVDNDLAMEIVVVEKNSAGMEELRIYEYPSFDLQSSVSLGNFDSSEVVIGNVDNDAANEIIVDSGFVIDGLSGAVQWQFTQGFGNRLAVGDIDNDGIDEVVATGGWQKPKVYSVPLKSEIMEIDNDDICTLNIVNVDNDPQEEIIVGNCQWGDVIVYDGSTGDAVQEALWDTVEHASISVIAGDITNDGKKEVIWGSGHTSTGEDVFVIGQLAPEVDLLWSNENPAQLDRFTAAGITRDADGNVQGVFVSPSTDSGYGDQRIVLMNGLGELTVSTPIASNWDDSDNALIVDYDKDGMDEIFLATSETYDGQFQVRQLNTNVVEASLGGDYADDIEGVKAHDMNGDGFVDAIIINGSKIMVFDAYNNEVLWESTSFQSVIHDVEIVSVPDQQPEIVVATNDELVVWAASGDIYVRAHTLSVTCQSIAVGELNAGGDARIVCVSKPSYLYDESSDVTVFTLDLDKLNSFSLDYRAQDVLIEPSEDRSNLLITFGPDYNFSYGDLERTGLMLLSPQNGEIVWRSPGLIGGLEKNSIQYIPTDSWERRRLIFATHDAMYLTF